MATELKRVPSPLILVPFNSLRHNIRFNGSDNWSEKHLHWLAESVNMPYPAQKVVYQEYLNSVTEANDRVKRFNKEILFHTQQWRLN